MIAFLCFDPSDRTWHTSHCHIGIDVIRQLVPGKKTYIGQLENPTKGAYDREKEALRWMTPGPGNWITPQDCWHLKESFGLSKSFEALEKIAWAATV